MKPSGHGLWQTRRVGDRFFMRSVKFFALSALLALAASQARSAGHDIYPEPNEARADIAAALKTAATTHRRVLLDFGGNWCGDCQALNIYFHDDHNRDLLEKNFVLVDTNIGHEDANLDIAREYGVPIEKGVPALAVLSPEGKLLYSQRNGEFEAMRRMESTSVTEFLTQWRPQRPGCSAVVVNC
jgi:thioredoxin 1